MKTLTILLFSTGLLFSQTAVFPGGAVTEQSLGLVANGVSGTLNNSLTTSSTSLGVTDGTCTLAGQTTACATAFQQYMFITVQNEIMQICSLSDSGTVTTLNFGVLGSGCPSLSGRGLDGSQIAAHTISSPNVITVYNNITAWTHNANAAEIIALESFLYQSNGNVRTQINGTSGSAYCYTFNLGNALSIVSCTLNGYAQTGSAQTYTFPFSMQQVPVLSMAGGTQGTCGTYNPTTTKSVLTLPANSGMTAESCNILVIGQ